MEGKVKRRPFVETNLKIPLIFQLVILLRNRKEVMYLCTRSSLALRVIGLCELAIKKQIESKEGLIVVTGSEQGILREFTNVLASVRLNCKDTIKFLNGEKGDNNKSNKGIKDLRNKIYKEMESKSIIKIKKGLVFNKITLTSTGIWQEVFDKVISEVDTNKISKETIALLICLDYVNNMESLLLQCNEGIARIIVDTVTKIRERMQTHKIDEEDKLLYEILVLLTE